MLMNTGDTPVESKNGLLTTVAVGLNGNVRPMRWRAVCSWAGRSSNGCGTS